MPKKNSELKDPREWVKDLDIESTEDIAVPKMLVDQVIGQKQGVEIVRKAAEQKRHVMLIGDPGTGKSMLAKSMSELLPKEELQDVLVYHNHEEFEHINKYMKYLYVMLCLYFIYLIYFLVVTLKFYVTICPFGS